MIPIQTHWMDHLDVIKKAIQVLILVKKCWTCKRSRREAVVGWLDVVGELVLVRQVLIPIVTH